LASQAKQEFDNAKQEFNNILQIAKELLKNRPKDEVLILKIYDLAKNRLVEINEIENS
jgi:hypothetical protein